MMSIIRVSLLLSRLSKFEKNQNTPCGMDVFVQDIRPTQIRTAEVGQEPILVANHHLPRHSPKILMLFLGKQSKSNHFQALVDTL